MSSSTDVVKNKKGTLLAWERLKTSVSETEPKDLIRFIIILVCILLVYLQVTACYEKLSNPGVISHTELKQNETMFYPALTICREPPLNRRKYLKYNIKDSHLASFPLLSQFVSFPFENYSLSDFLEDTMYTDKVFVAQGLGTEVNKTTISSSVHLTVGRCFTVIPQNYTSKQFGKKYGYSITINHDMYDYKPLLDDPPGWYVYLHEVREPFSENVELLASRQDVVFVHVGEEIEINLEAMEFKTIRNCNNSNDYSVTRCEERCWVNDILKSANCTGPWFPWVDLTECDNYADFAELYRNTLRMAYKNCCLPQCNTKQYTTSIVKRTGLTASLRSTIFIYFTSKAVLTLEESYAYDWNLFVADLGGSLGFLLGLSVIGIISVIEDFVNFMCGVKSKKGVEETSKHNDEISFEYSKWKLDVPLKLPLTNLGKRY